MSRTFLRWYMTHIRQTNILTLDRYTWNDRKFSPLSFPPLSTSRPHKFVSKTSFSGRDSRYISIYAEEGGGRARIPRVFLDATPPRGYVYPRGHRHISNARSRAFQRTSVASHTCTQNSVPEREREPSHLCDLRPRFKTAVCSLCPGIPAGRWTWVITLEKPCARISPPFRLPFFGRIPLSLSLPLSPRV